MKTAFVVAVIAMVLVAFCVAPVAANMANSHLYTSKYADVAAPYATTGQISGQLRCANNLMTSGINITDPNGITTPLEILPDGTFFLSGLAPGQYTINIADGNGGQPESATADVRAGYTSFLNSELLGHGVATSIPLEAMTVTANIDGCNMFLNGLKLVKDELIQVPERIVTIMKRVKVITQAYVPAVSGVPAVTHQVEVCTPGTPAVPAVTHTETIIDVPAVAATPATGVPCSQNAQGHVHAVNNGGGNSQTDFYYGTTPMHIIGNGGQTFIVTPGHAAIPAVTHTVVVIDSPAIPAGAPVCHMETVIDSPAIPAVPAIPEISHYEMQPVQVTLPAYSYYTYKLEGRATLRSIDTTITNPNDIALNGVVTVVVQYTVDNNFGQLLNTNTDLQTKTKTFVGTFTGIPQGTTLYDGNIAFSQRINDAAIVDGQLPTVISSDIVTDIPEGYFLN